MAWSADGSRILFSSSSGNFWETSLARPGDAQKLPFGYDAQDIAVSPSAHRLVYVQGVTNTNIWRLDLQASPPTADKLVLSSRQQIAPSISPNGSKIAFQSDRTGPNEVWVCDADGSNPIQLSSFGIKVTGTPRWSPDGRWVAFDSRAGGEANIYLVDPLGGVPRKLEIDIHGLACRVGRTTDGGSISTMMRMPPASRYGKCRLAVATPCNSPRHTLPIRSNHPTASRCISFVTRDYGA